MTIEQLEVQFNLLQGEFDVLVGHHAQALQHIEGQAKAIDALIARIDTLEADRGIEPAPELAKFMRKVVVDGVKRHHFDSAGFLGTIVERDR